MGYLHDLGNPKVKEVTERAIKQIVSSGRTCGTSPLSLEEAQRHHALGGQIAMPISLVAVSLCFSSSREK
jgi:2-keto-3-deoxy-L-rhamnonate aldolase RhmA